MKTEYIAAEVRDNNIGIITLNNPQTLNSVNEQMLGEFVWQLREFNNNEQIHVIVIKGIEKSFAAGIDIKELAANIGKAKIIMRNMQHNFQTLISCRKPLIAAVSGFALGIGCEIALCCDIVLATDNARFGLPELSIGLLPCFSGCGLLTERIGRAKAADMILTGRALSADEAETAGLVSRIVTAETLEEEYIKIARRIAALPQTPVSAAKRIISEHDQKTSADLETLLCLNCIESGDFKQTLKNFASPKSSGTEKA